jgi:predicted CXXCH cytochrome family protein
LERGNKLCFGCHADKGRKVGFPHAPVAGEKGCLACHRPHAAKNDHLLVEKVAGLCFTCHQKTKDAPKTKHCILPS